MKEVNLQNVLDLF